MYALDSKEQSVRDKKLLSVLQNFAQNECVLRYWPSVLLKMNWRKHAPLYQKGTEQNQNSPMETTNVNPWGSNSINVMRGRSNQILIRL